MNGRDWALTIAWALFLVQAIALFAVGPDALYSMQTLFLVQEKPQYVVAIVLLSFFGGLALHGRFTKNLTK